MRRRCADQPGEKGLTDGPGCGLFYDDAERSTICPHRELNPLTPWPMILGMFAILHEGLAELGRR